MFIGKFKPCRAFLSLILVSLISSFCFTLEASQEEAPSVSSQMKLINSTLRELRRQINDVEEVEANLALVKKLKEYVSGAQRGEPSKTTSVPESERRAFLEGYRALLGEVTKTLERLEDAIKQGQMDKAEALVNELNELKKSGHSKYQD